jgi:hypothetical protein
MLPDPTETLMLAPPAKYPRLVVLGLYTEHCNDIILLKYDINILPIEVGKAPYFNRGMKDLLRWYYF